MMAGLWRNYWVESTLNTYSIVWFSDRKWLGLLLLLVSCMTPKIGIIGLLFVLVFNGLLTALGYHRELIRSGLLGFNALLVGMGLAYSYNVNAYFIGLFAIAQCLTVWTVIWCKNYFDRYHLPFLTIPFVLVMNIVALAANTYDVFTINMDYVFFDNVKVLLEQDPWYRFVHCLDNSSWVPQHFQVFLYTLSTIFFQKSLLAGWLILGGLWLSSRLVTLYALLGFYAALFFFWVMGGDTATLSTFYTGANFIFMAISLGCFFYVANRHSLLLVLALTPVVLFLMITLNKIMFAFQMNSMSLSFSVITAMTLYILQHRHEQKWLIPANIFLNSPEKALYEYQLTLQRKTPSPYYRLMLPFWGSWKVSQGYDGGITHLGDWGKALDFVIEDTDGKTYSGWGETPDLYYCYNKPVVAPADGYIYDIVNHVDDNGVNDVNLVENWGNTLVMNHTNGLFTQMSHIKKDSFTVVIGQYVRQGEVLAYCGNSGRSPEPHLHFQVQHSPVIGAPTVAVPLSYFVEWKGAQARLAINEVPQEGATVSGIETLPLLSKAFYFSTQQQLKILDVRTQKAHVYEIKTNAYNHLYWYCPRTESALYFKQDGVMLTMEYFVGDRRSPLFHWYESCYSVLLGHYPNLQLNYPMPVYHFNAWGWQWLHDIFAPLFALTQIEYKAIQKQIDGALAPEWLRLETQTQRRIGPLKLGARTHQIKVSTTQIEIENEHYHYLVICE